MTPNKQLKRNAWEALSGHWGTSIGVIVVFWLLAIVSGTVPFGGILLVPAFTVGLYIYFINLTRNGNPVFSNLFDGFDNYGKTVLAGLLVQLIKIAAGILYAIAAVSFFVLPIIYNIDAIEAGEMDFMIWTGIWWKMIILFLLAIPLLWVSIKLSQVFILLADNPDIKGDTAISASWKMMKGYEWKYVGLILSFIGWYALIIFTLGIASLWAMPYIRASLVEFYYDIKQDFDLTPYLQTA